jgi:micrococcal nuclease
MEVPNKDNCYNYKVLSVDRVVDGDTVDVVIDLGFYLYKKERVRLSGIDAPEIRTRDSEEKVLGYDATNWLENRLKDASERSGDIFIRTELDGSFGKYGRLLGWIYIGGSEVSINEEMVLEGYAHRYVDGERNDNWEILREIRRSRGTLI